MQLSNNNEIELCLCPVCASNFYNIPSYRIRRKNPYQSERDVCTYCSCRLGFDYLVLKKSSVRNGTIPPIRTLERGTQNE